MLLHASVFRLCSPRWDAREWRGYPDSRFETRGRGAQLRRDAARGYGGIPGYASMTPEERRVHAMQKRAEARAKADAERRAPQPQLPREPGQASRPQAAQAPLPQQRLDEGEPPLPQQRPDEGEAPLPQHCPDDVDAALAEDKGKAKQAGEGEAAQAVKKGKGKQAGEGKAAQAEGKGEAKQAGEGEAAQVEGMGVARQAEGRGELAKAEKATTRKKAKRQASSEDQGEARSDRERRRGKEPHGNRIWRRVQERLLDIEEHQRAILRNQIAVFEALRDAGGLRRPWREP